MAKRPVVSAIAEGLRTAKEGWGSSMASILFLALVAVAVAIPIALLSRKARRDPPPDYALRADQLRLEVVVEAVDFMRVRANGRILATDLSMDDKIGEFFKVQRGAQDAERAWRHMPRESLRKALEDLKVVAASDPHARERLRRCEAEARAENAHLRAVSRWELGL